MKHDHHHNSSETLHAKGLKSTPLRMAILELLNHHTKPMSAEEIGYALKNLDFDRATLFRSLKTFSETGLLSVIDLGEGSLRYERNCDVHHHHHHILCTHCKEIEVVPFCIPDEFKKFLHKKGYKEINHRMDFTGICKNCSR